jgi:hypothetical protein
VNKDNDMSYKSVLIIAIKMMIFTDSEECYFSEEYRNMLCVRGFVIFNSHWQSAKQHQYFRTADDIFGHLLKADTLFIHAVFDEINY